MNLILLFAVLATVASTGLAARVVCYYANWSVYKPDPFKIENIDPTLCTHVVYSFIGIDANGYLKLLDPWNDIGDEYHEGGLKKFQKLRTLNPSAKLIIGVGGWNEGPVKFQAMVRSPEKRRAFLDSSMNFLRQYKFDGLEIAWMYHDGYGGTPEDKAGFSALLKEMRPKYQEGKFILSASTSALRKVMDNSYDIPVLSKNLDFINIISYDLHGSWDHKTGHVAPLHAMNQELGEDRFMNVESVVNRYIEKGASPDKLNIGTVGYGRTFTLFDSTNHVINSPTTGPGKTEPLSYAQFCVQDKNGVWTKFRNLEQVVPYAVAGDQWVGYEDAASLTAKAKFAKSKKVGGVTFWSLDVDDFKGACAFGKFPLLKALKEEMTK